MKTKTKEIDGYSFLNRIDAQSLSLLPFLYLCAVASLRDDIPS
jgi:hypothetical protein